MMKKIVNVLIHMFLLVLLLGGCSPQDAYLNEVEAIYLPAKLENIETGFQNMCIQINKWLLTKEAIPSELSNNMSTLKQETYSLDEGIRSIVTSEEELATAHLSLIEAINAYTEMFKNVDELIKHVENMNTLEAMVEHTEKQILDVILSGDPTSIEYNQGLSDFAKEHNGELVLFNLQRAQELLSAKKLDQVLIEDAIKGSKQTILKMQDLETFSETDKKVNGLLMLMYEQILDMYVYALSNQKFIEWTNGYEDFDAYAKEEEQRIKNHLQVWRGVVFE